MAYQPRETAVHKSLLEVKKIGGVESKMAILNGTIAAALTMGMETLYMIPIAVFMHMLLRWLTRKDDQIIKIYGQYKVFADIYDPWPRRKMRTNSRPKGFSKGMLC